MIPHCVKVPCGARHSLKLAYQVHIKLTADFAMILDSWYDEFFNHQSNLHANSECTLNYSLKKLSSIKMANDSPLRERSRLKLDKASSMHSKHAWSFLGYCRLCYNRRFNAWWGITFQSQGNLAPFCQVGTHWTFWSNNCFVRKPDLCLLTYEAHFALP